MSVVGKKTRFRKTKFFEVSGFSLPDHHVIQCSLRLCGISCHIDVVFRSLELLRRILLLTHAVQDKAFPTNLQYEPKWLHTVLCMHYVHLCEDPGARCQDPLCNHYATTMQPPCNHCATTVQPLCNHCATTVQPLCNHCATTMQPLCNHCATTVQTLCNRCGITYYM